MKSESTRLIVLLVLLVSGGCALETLEPEVGDVRAGLCTPEDSDPERDVSFEDDILPLFERPFGQAGCSCHLPSSRRTSGIDATGLALDSYRALMRGGDDPSKRMVVPGDPCSSVLVQKVSSAPPSGARMPPDGPPYLSASEQALIRDWILEGAHDD